MALPELLVVRRRRLVASIARFLPSGSAWRTSALVGRGQAYVAARQPVMPTARPAAPEILVHDK